MNRKQNEVTIGYFQNCICLDFLGIVVSLLGQQGKWMPCKYLYYILQLMMFCGKFENFIHFPTWSYGAICHLLDRNLAPKEVIHVLK
jgi:hypothetical protein